MKSYTDLVQSKKLAEILPLESADNVIVSIGDREGVKTITMPKETLNIIRTPFSDIRETTMCWSLAALLDVLSYPQLSKDKLGSGKVGWMVSVYPNDCRYDSCWHDNPIDACVAMIESLHELKML
jgi:hypothetical protein